MLKGSLQPISSCLVRREGEGVTTSMLRAILEVYIYYRHFEEIIVKKTPKKHTVPSNLQIIVGGVASTPQDVRLYASCSLLAASLKLNMKKELDEETSKGAIEACVEWLMDNEFISIQKEGEGQLFCIFFC